MNWFTAVVLYTMIWWTALFAVLPFWTRPVTDASAEDGGWRGAPERPMLGRKVLVTTLVATAAWIACMLVIHSGLVSFRSGWLYMPDK